MDGVLVRNYTIGGFKRGEMVGMAMVPAYFGILNSLKFRLILPKNCLGSGGRVEDFWVCTLVLIDTAMAAEFDCCRMLEQKQSTMGSNTNR